MENNDKIMLIFLRTPGSRFHFLRCLVTLMPDPRRVRRCWQGDQEGAEPYQLQKAVCPAVWFLPQEAEMLFIRVWMSHEQGLPEP